MAVSVAKTFHQIAVRVDATVAQEGPDAPHVLAAGQIHIYNEHRAAMRAGLGKKLALRSGDKTAAPERNAVAHGGRIWADSQVGAGSSFTFVLKAAAARVLDDDTARVQS